MLDSNLIPLTIAYGLAITSIILLAARLKRMRDD